MTEPVSRAVVEGFYAAYESRDALRIGEFLDDNVEWHIAGPVEVMQVCGQWRGKAAVIDRFARAMPQVVDFKGLERECLLVDGDCSALFGRIICRHVASGRTISHRLAHFARYRSGKVVSMRIINDSLDAVEQYIGHRINLVPGEAPSDGNLVAV